MLARLSSTAQMTFSAEDMARITEIEWIVIAWLSEMNDVDEG
ncbi:hypothetical protein [Neoroseomonas eburnea]|nr:hypothetical protein [Neoroseomonas eburnea]